MSDATRDQIARDASEWWAKNDGPVEDPDGLFEDAYIDGATHQHPIAFADGVKEGYNQAIEDAIKFLRKDQDESYHGWVGGQLQYYETELEKLKKP